MGGLVSRCYLECGEFNGNSAFGCVRTLITIGTPHRGAAAAALFAAGVEKKLFLSKAQVRELANDVRYPSTYELLPPEGEPFAWPYEDAAQIGVRNIYDDATAKAIGLSRENLTAARAFHGRLNPNKRPSGVRYFAFYGTHLSTITNISLRANGTALSVAPISMDSGGDGTVPVWSTLPGVQSLPVGQEHMKLFRDGDLRRTLAILLGAPGRLAAPREVVVVANDRVVEPDQPVSVALVFPGGATAVDGSVRWVQMVTDDAGKMIGSEPAGDAAVVQYSGAPAERLSLQLISPAFPGFYRIEFVDTAGTPSSPDEIVVQG
jgi:hypothetical protein